MKLVFKIFFIFLIVTNFLMAQPSNYRKHIVSKGETITQIALKYKVTPYDIYRLNPDAQNGIQESTTLLIPSSIINKEPNGSLKTHDVQSQETLFGIAKLYNTSVEELERLNPDVKKEGLKIGQTIQVAGNKVEVKQTETLSEQAVFHEVQPKETLYGISKQYNVTVEELEILNPDTKAGLVIGQKLIIQKGKAVKNTTSNATKKIEVPTDGKYLIYKVKPQETLFGLSKMFRLNQEELIALNPELNEGVKEGMELKVPANISINTGIVRKVKDLSTSVSVNEKKEIVLLIPFNASNIESDTTLSTQARLKRDGFLNMTLDFYAGALMAIDSAKRLGLNFNVKIFDSQETKSSSNVLPIIRNNNVQNAHAVIGPFYPQYVEKAAELLNPHNVPVISPLRETSKTYSNLYQSMPSGDFVKNVMFDYIRSKGGNMIALIDRKKGSSKQFIEEFHKDIFIAPLAEKGGVIGDSIMPKLSKSKINYFILETATTGMVLNVLKYYNELKSEGYQMELVVLDINPTFETDEVFPRILKQNIIFPSLTKFQDTSESLGFATSYKKKNNVYPNQYAIRGFDIVFDTMLRLSQDEDFETTIQATATEGIENKFDYEKKLASGYSNKGIYIMRYDEDLTAKPIE